MKRPCAAHQGVVLDARFVFAAGGVVAFMARSGCKASGPVYSPMPRDRQGLASAAGCGTQALLAAPLPVFRGRNEPSAHHRYPYPHPDPGNCRPAAARRRRKVPVTHHARSTRRYAALDVGGVALPAVPDRRFRHRAPLARHGCGRRRRARALGHAADLSLQPGRRADRRHRRHPERPDRQAHRRASDALHGDRHAADAGAGSAPPTSSSAP